MWRDVRCPGCYRRCRYRDFRAFEGDPFESVRAMLWVNDDDPGRWKYKSRGVILGLAHQIKREMWEDFTNRCPEWGKENPGDSTGTEKDLDPLPF